MKIKPKYQEQYDMICLELKELGQYPKDIGLQYDGTTWTILQSISLPKTIIFSERRLVIGTIVGSICFSYHLEKSNVDLIYFDETVYCAFATTKDFEIKKFNLSRMSATIKSALFKTIVRASEQGKKISGIENLPKSMRQELMFI